jgi:hypothetical protein
MRATRLLPNQQLVYNRTMPESTNPRLDRVLAQLNLYEHPLLNFSARAKGEGVGVIIQFKDPKIPVHTYCFDLHPRDLDDAQFEWSFQRQLYDALHDYFVEMFIRTPQDRLLRQNEDRQNEDRQSEDRQSKDRPTEDHLRKAY